MSNNRSMGNGYGAFDNYKRNNGIEGKGPQGANQNTTNNSVKDSLQNAKNKAKKTATKKALTTAAKAYNPAVGKVVEKALDTKKGEEYLDEFAKGSTNSQGIRNVAHKIKKDTQKIKLIIGITSILGPVILLMFICLLLFKQGDSQIYANQNDGEVEVEIDDTKLSNVFKQFPGLYEKIQERVEEVSNQYGVEVDKYLVIATLIAPISNETIVPTKNEKCGTNEAGEYNPCYMYDGEYYAWEDFLDVWGNQAGLLSKMQIITDVNIESTRDYKNACKSDDNTMEAYAKNDNEVRSVHWYDYFNPSNWFTDNLALWRRTEAAEVNARCNDASKGESIIPDVYSISKEEGNYKVVVKEDGKIEYDYDPNSGGVYFWNLINQGGFIQTYLKDYISYDPNLSEEENYEKSRATIVNIVNYIYDYYDSIRRDCQGVDVMDSTLKKVRVHNVKSPDISRYGEYMDIDLEVYVGCVIMAEYNTENVAASEAFAIMARTEGVAHVGLDGSGEIENSSNDQNCNLYKYNPTYDPSYENQNDNPNYDPDYPKTHNAAAYKAIQNTKGIVVSEFNEPKIKHTLYDAFCPVKTEPENGMYYLPDGQRNLPVKADEVHVPEEYLKCPCFQSEEDRPGDNEFVFQTSPTEPPTGENGYPSQEFPDSCWLLTDETRESADATEYKWRYKPSGGHGEGMSQIGSGYFATYGYSRYALIKLFYDRENEFGESEYHIGFKRLESAIEDNMCNNRLILGKLD